VVDDEAGVRRVVATALRRFGHDVLVAGGYEEAMDLARREGNGLDLILADVMMPRRTGPELVTELLPYCPRARVVFTTGYTTREMAGAGAHPGAVWLEKPFSIDELLDALRRALAAEAPPRDERAALQGHAAGPRGRDPAHGLRDGGVA
jgi:DNA-binding NtrC family response regulator